MRKAKILEFFNDINYAYNNSGMHESLSIMLNEMEQEIRNKVIDEFAEELKKCKFYSIERYENCVPVCEIDWLAEQMKGE